MGADSLPVVPVLTVPGASPRACRTGSASPGMIGVAARPRASFVSATGGSHASVVSPSPGELRLASTGGGSTGRAELEENGRAAVHRDSASAPDGVTSTEPCPADALSGLAGGASGRTSSGPLGPPLPARRAVLFWSRGGVRARNTQDRADERCGDALGATLPDLWGKDIALEVKEWGEQGKDGRKTWVGTGGQFMMGGTSTEEEPRSLPKSSDFEAKVWRAR